MPLSKRIEISKISRTIVKLSTRRKLSFIYTILIFRSFGITGSTAFTTVIAISQSISRNS